MVHIYLQVILYLLFTYLLLHPYHLYLLLLYRSLRLAFSLHPFTYHYGEPSAAQLTNRKPSRFTTIIPDLNLRLHIFFTVHYHRAREWGWEVKYKSWTAIPFSSAPSKIWSQVKNNILSTKRIKAIRCHQIKKNAFTGFTKPITRKFALLKKLTCS